MYRDSEIWKVVIESEHQGIMVLWARDEKESNLLIEKYTSRLKKKLIYAGCYAIPVQITRSGVIDFLNKYTPKFDNGKLINIFESYYLN